MLGAQEAVGSNPAVPTFRFNHLRASLICPFCFADSFADSLEIAVHRTYSSFDGKTLKLLYDVELTATLANSELRGDWGTIDGTFENGQLQLSHFDGINDYLLKARLTEEGRLEGLINSERKMIAERADNAKPGAFPHCQTRTTTRSS